MGLKHSLYDGLDSVLKVYDSEDESDTVTFTPGTATNITNPLNGETVEFTATVLSPTLMQTRSSGLETKTVEMKTWHFSYIGVALASEIVKEGKLLPDMSNQVMLRVDEENNEKPLSVILV